MGQKSVLVLGAGLAGLATASALADAGYRVTVVERSPMAGGCTSSWVDHRDPDGNMLRKGNQQMGFNFYVNLYAFSGRRVGHTVPLRGRYEDADWYAMGARGWSHQLSGYWFHGNDDRRSRLSAEPANWFSAQWKHLPAPLNAMQMLLDCDALSWGDKLSLIRFHMDAVLYGAHALPPISDEYNFYGLLKRYGVSEGGVRFMRMITYSITNLADFDQVGPKFMHLFYLAYMRDGTIGCRMQSDDCNVAIIDPAVRSLQEQGVIFRFNSTVTDILVERNVARGAVIEDASEGRRVVCPNCGILVPIVSDIRFCPSCGHRRMLAAAALEAPPSRKETLLADYVVSAMQPHQLAAVLNEHGEHPFYAHPYFQRLNKFQGAVITVSRVHMDRQTTEGYNLTGLDRDGRGVENAFNGTMDISHVMPKFKGHSVYDLLSDDAESLQVTPTAQLKAKLQADLKRVFPSIKEGKIVRHNLAHLAPQVLYHRPYAGLRDRYLTKGPDTPVERLLRAGTSTDPFELGMEAAVRTGYIAANRILELEGRPEDRLPILQPKAEWLVRWLQENPVSRWHIARRWKEHLKHVAPPRGIPPQDA